MDIMIANEGQKISAEQVLSIDLFNVKSESASVPIICGYLLVSNSIIYAISLLFPEIY